MLSAVAARRARLAAQQAAEAVQTPSGSHSEVTSSATQSRDDELVDPSTSERKLKRRKKSINAPEAPAEPSQAPRSPSSPESAIERVIKKAKNNDEVTFDDIGKAVDELVQGDGRVLRKGKGKQRAWSPSRPYVSGDEAGSEDLGSNASDWNEGEEEPEGEDALALAAHDSEDEQASESDDAPEIPTDIRLSTFVPKVNENVFHFGPPQAWDPHKCYAKDVAGVLIKMAPGETLTLYGTYILVVLFGVVSLNGIELIPTAKQHEVFAPKCWPLPTIRATGKSVQDHKSTVDYMGEFDALVPGLAVEPNTIILLKPLKTGIEDLHQVCGTVGKSFVDDSVEFDDISLLTARMMTYRTPKTEPFYIPPSWQEALNAFPTHSALRTEKDEIPLDLETKPYVIMVKGPKRTGKSTFARTILNKLTTVYRRVAFLECDMGFPEFTPHGIVSLTIIDHPVFGPPFTHLITPYESHFIGADNPQVRGLLFLDMVKALVQTYRSEVQYPDSYDPELDDGRIGDVVPLVVNTFAWTKGMNADIVRRIEEIVEPTHVVYVDLPTYHFEQREPPSNPFAFGLPPVPLDEPNPALTGNPYMPESIKIPITPIPPGVISARFTPEEWRTIALMSYFHLEPPSDLPPLSSKYSALPSPACPAADQISSDFASRECRADGLLWQAIIPLPGCAPFDVYPEGAFDEIVLVGPGFEDIVPDELGNVLNTSVVALVYNPTKKLTEPLFEPTYYEEDGVKIGCELDTEITRLYHQGSSPPYPENSCMVGLVFIRALAPTLFTEHEWLDYPQTKWRTCPPIMQLLTPMPAQLLGLGRCMVMGQVEIPIWGFLDYRDPNWARDKPAPYLTWETPTEFLFKPVKKQRRNLKRGNTKFFNG